MKVLILSCATGEGHNSAARAMHEVFISRNIECDIVDTTGFGGEKSRKIVANSYNSIVRKSPASFGVIYKIGDKYSSTKMPSPVYFANTLYAKKLSAFITENGYDIAIWLSWIKINIFINHLSCCQEI